MKKLILLLMMLCTVNAQAKDIYVNGAIPKVNSVLAATSADVIYLQAGEEYDGDVIVRVANITIRKTGIGADPVVKPVGKGATFCFLQQADNLTLINIHLDCSKVDTQASHFGIRQEWNAKGLTLINCTVTEPPSATYDKHQTSRKQMNFDSISTDIQYSHITVTNTKFYNVQNEIPSFMEKAYSDSTIVTSGITISATAVIGVEP